MGYYGFSSVNVIANHNNNNNILPSAPTLSMAQFFAHKIGFLDLYDIYALCTGTNMFITAACRVTLHDIFLKKF